MTTKEKRDPFLVEGPALISFSGGRTSGYMLRRVLDAGLQPDVHIVFANTGKERLETLDFVRDCAVNWGVPVRWVERRETGFVEVTHESASRNGEPFAALVTKRKFLPNPVTRFCTQELKIRVMRDFMKAQGFETWTNIVGIRADEPRRVARMRAPHRDRWENEIPLADAGVTEADVLAFWKKQPFDLGLRTWEGNCDLCFLKGGLKKERIILERPDLATWWIEQEARMKATFRADSPSYARMLDTVTRQVRLPIAMAEEMDDLGDCVCHD